MIRLRLILRSAAELLGRVSARRGEPAIGVCGLCHLSSSDPVVGCCSNPCCPLAMRSAA